MILSTIILFLCIIQPMGKLSKIPKKNVFYRAWRAKEPRAVLVLVHGIGAYSLRWSFLAEYFLKHNISSYALELSGFGQTPGLKGHVDSFNVYYREIKELALLARAQNKNKKVFLVGESMGGLIAYNMAALEPALFDGLIAVSPAFKNKMKFRIADYFLLLFGVIFSPKLMIHLPFKGSEITHDKSYKDKLSHDKKEIRHASVKLLFNILLAQITARHFKKILIPFFFLVAGEDFLVDVTAINKVYKRASAVKKIKRYPGMFHALTVDQGKERVFKDILQWVLGSKPCS